MQCSGSFNNVNDSYTKLCIPHDAKNINVKAFNLMSRTIETRHIEWKETYKCKCRLDASFCNNKQRWNKDNINVNVSIYLRKEDMIKDLFGILIIVIVNVINHMMLENI